MFSMHYSDGKTYFLRVFKFCWVFILVILWFPFRSLPWWVRRRTGSGDWCSRGRHQKCTYTRPCFAPRCLWFEDNRSFYRSPRALKRWFIAISYTSFSCPTLPVRLAEATMLLLAAALQNTALVRDCRHWSGRRRISHVLSHNAASPRTKW